MAGYYTFIGAQSRFGLLLLRLMTGIVFTYHGYQKFFVIGVGGVTGFFEKIGIPLAQVTAPCIATLEFVGGILLILGIFTRVVAGLFTIEFIVATYAAWVLLGRGYSGSELELMLLFSSFLLATHGSGVYALHARLRLPGE
jgi:putative oxidoreductase